MRENTWKTANKKKKKKEKEKKTVFNTKHSKDESDFGHVFGAFEGYGVEVCILYKFCQFRQY